MGGWEVGEGTGGQGSTSDMPLCLFRWVELVGGWVAGLVSAKKFVFFRNFSLAAAGVPCTRWCKSGVRTRSPRDVCPQAASQPAGPQRTTALALAARVTGAGVRYASGCGLVSVLTCVKQNTLPVLDCVGNQLTWSKSTPFVWLTSNITLLSPPPPPTGNDRIT